MNVVIVVTNDMNLQLFANAMNPVLGVTNVVDYNIQLFLKLWN